MGVACAPLVGGRRGCRGQSKAVRAQWVELLVRWRTKLAYTGRAWVSVRETDWTLIFPMHRPLAVRALSLLLSLWLPLFMSGAEWAVRCPTHGGVHPVAAQHATGDDHASHDAAGQHADHGAGKHTCSCPGPGCCPTAVAVVPVITVPMTHVALVHEARAVSTLDLFSSDRGYLLPFATAPPAAAIAPAASIVA